MSLRPGWRLVSVLNPMDQGGLIAPLREPRAVNYVYPCGRNWYNAVPCRLLDLRQSPDGSLAATTVVSLPWPVPFRDRPLCRSGGGRRATR